MIKILYDSQIFNAQRFGGISRYFSELISGIKQTDGFEALPVKFYSQNKHLRSVNMTSLDHFRDRIKFKGKGRIENYIKSKGNEVIKSILKKGDFDIFHPTYYDPGFINIIPANKPFVITVYDMIHELYVDKQMEMLHQETINKRKLLPKATHIVAISQQTKNDILHFFPKIDKDKISVIYLASSLNLTLKEVKLHLPERYLLFVGNRGYYKNFIWMINSLADFILKNNLVLICAGGGDFSQFEMELILKNNVATNVLYVDINSDNELITLYKNALCFIFPSIYEGFGIPILEAFSCKCPVILANSSCFSEVAGDAALYFDLDKPNQLIQQIKKVIDDAELTKTLKNAGLKRNQLFSWENTIKQHTKIYKDVVASVS